MASTSPRSRRSRASYVASTTARSIRGFTYIGLLLAVALAGVTLAAVGTLWSTEVKRDREVELLFVGDQYRSAIASFYETVPSGQQPRFPRSIDELLLDRRFPTVRRHLRKHFKDPLNGADEWGLVRGPGGAITGVFSQSTGVPLKRDGFPPAYRSFATAKVYADWKFVYAPVASPAAMGGGAIKPSPSTGSVGSGEQAPAVPTRAAEPRTAVAEQVASVCDAQRLGDVNQCFELRANEADGFRRCIESVSRRQTACLRGEALPPLMAGLPQ